MAPVLVLAACTQSAVVPTPARTTADITDAELRHRLEIIADDSMQGREAGRLGNLRAARYVAHEAQRLGLRPAGDSGFLQRVPLVLRAPDTTSHLVLEDGSGFRFGADILPMRSVGFAPFGKAFRGTSVPVVFGGRIGETLIDPSLVAGKVVVLAQRSGADGRPSPQVLFQAGLLERYSGAALVLVSGLEGLTLNVLRFLESPGVVLADTVSAPATIALARISTRAAERLMGGSLRLLPLGSTGQRVSGTVLLADEPTESPAYNVVAVVPGTDPALRSQYVALGAHTDHIGMLAAAFDHDSVFATNRVMRLSGANEPARLPNVDQRTRITAARDSLTRLRAGKRDSIFNGADDDASGASVLLELAEYFAAHPARRPLLFVWHTAEEQGLFGAEYYTDHPTVPRDSIVAQVNLDQVSRGGPIDIPGSQARTLYVLGPRRLSQELGDIVDTVNARERHRFVLDRSLDAPGHPANGWCRSDHYMYARYGIPVAFFSAGWHADYHMVTDEAQYANTGTMLRVAEFVGDIARTVADLDHRVALSAPKPADPHGACRQ